jgi:hypothetical protein
MKTTLLIFVISTLLFLYGCQDEKKTDTLIEEKVEALVSQMTLAEKI